MFIFFFCSDLIRVEFCERLKWVQLNQSTLACVSYKCGIHWKSKASTCCMTIQALMDYPYLTMVDLRKIAPIPHLHISLCNRTDRCRCEKPPELCNTAVLTLTLNYIYKSIHKVKVKVFMNTAKGSFITNPCACFRYIH